MKEVQIEFPAYNIFLRQGGDWKLHNAPIIGRPYNEVYNIATGILFWNKTTEAVRIYGVFNCQQTFIQEMSKKDFPKPESNEDRMRTAIKDAIAICDKEKEMGFFGGSAILAIEKMRKVLSDAIETTKDVSWREKKGI